MWHPFLSAVISIPVTGYFTLLYFISYSVLEEVFVFYKEKLAKNKQRVNSKDIAHVLYKIKNSIIIWTMLVQQSVLVRNRATFPCYLKNQTKRDSKGKEIPSLPTLMYYKVSKAGYYAHAIYYIAVLSLFFIKETTQKRNLLSLMFETIVATCNRFWVQTLNNPYL